MLLAAAPHALAQAPSQPVEKRFGLCEVCHGRNGESRTPLVPSLGGQPAFFVAAQLFLFRDGRRGDVARGMYDAARGLTDDDLRAFGEYIAKLPPPPPPGRAADAARFARGRKIAESNHCPVCHNPDYSGREQMPRLANQREDYLLKALRDYKSGARIGYGRGMPEALAPLADGDLVDVAHFLAYFPSRRPAPPGGPK